jgi:hypothetical protein
MFPQPKSLNFTNSPQIFHTPQPTHNLSIQMKPNYEEQKV